MMLHNTTGMSNLKVEHIPVVTRNETSGLRTVFLNSHTIRSATLSVGRLKGFYCTRITGYKFYKAVIVISKSIQGLSKRFEHLLLWPPRSPDLTPCDFFLWRFVKDNAYKPQTARLHSSCGANH
jgi:hypothetical protein